MIARQTYSEKRWPDTPEFNSVLRSWKSAGSVILLELVWSSYDLFCKEVLTKIDCSKEDKDLERDITQNLEPEIRETMSGFEPFYVQHGPYEHETSLPAPAQPPLYDIAFRLRAYPRVMWPLEAKLLRTEGSVAEYINEVRSNFLTCRYAPFSKEAAMLGYLLSGSSDILFDNISQKGGWDLKPHINFPNREHRISDHERKIPEGKSYSQNFRLHHLVLKIRITH
ncbi:MAG: hypothetical protein JW715_00130 [Sedimentisphaerales bacterium]|nr:hypothetical protein [Sedimentisphaerales bacterium]